MREAISSHQQHAPAKAGVKQGAYLGSVRCLESLRERCVVDDITGCWHLRSARGRDLSKRGGRYQPLKVHVHGRGGLPARRVAWEFTHDRAPGPDDIVSNVCTSSDCISPKHLRLFTLLEFGLHLRKTGAAKTARKQAAIAKMSRARSNTRLTEELAQWVRESDQKQHDVAHALGCSQQRVSDIRSGKSWKRPAFVGSSVFAWAG